MTPKRTRGVSATDHVLHLDLQANGLTMCKRSTLRVNCFTGGALDLDSEELCRQCVAAYRAIPRDQAIKLGA